MKLSFEDAEKALDSGRLFLRRPHGDYVRCRRRGTTRKLGPSLPIYMEAQVEAVITAKNIPLHPIRIEPPNAG